MKPDANYLHLRKPEKEKNAIDLKQQLGIECKA
jgi:hypothetical protein